MFPSAAPVGDCSRNGGTVDAVVTTKAFPWNPEIVKLLGFSDLVFREFRLVVLRPASLGSIPLAVSIVVTLGPNLKVVYPDTVTGSACMPHHDAFLERSMYSGPREHVSPDVLPLYPEVGVSLGVQRSCPQVAFARAVNRSLEAFVS